MSNMHVKASITTEGISTILVEFILFFILVYPYPTNLRSIVIVIAFIWTIFRRIKHKKGVNYRHILWAVLFYLFVLLSRIWAFNEQGVDDVGNNVLWSVMSTIIIADYIAFYELNTKRVAKIIMPMALLFVANVLLFGVNDQNSRLSISNNSNTFGAMAACMLGPLIYTFLNERNKKLSQIIIMIALFIICLLSGSRQSIITVMIYFIFYYLTKDIGDRKAWVNIIKRTIIVLILLLSSYVAIMKIEPLYKSIGNRFEDTIGFISGEQKADASTYSRINMINLAKETIRDNFWIGTGANNYKYMTYYKTYSHNNYIELLYDFGIIGLLLFYLPLVILLIKNIRCLRDKRQEKNKELLMPICILIAFFAGGITTVSYFLPVEYLQIGIAAGLSYYNNPTRNRKIKDNNENNI